MDALGRLEPPPRLVDWSILVLVALEVGSGLVSLTVGHPTGAWLFDVHAVGGITLVALLGYKLRRVWPRVREPGLRDAGTAVSVGLLALAIGALATGIAWTLVGAVRVAGRPLVFGHMVLGVLVVPALLWHLRHRIRPPSGEDVQPRRTTLQYATLLGAGALVWRLKTVGSAFADLAGADRRFTGSKTAGTGDGNAFPVTSWVADDPDPIDPASWQLTVDGEVERPLAVSADDLAPAANRHAVLDCTSGWYSIHDWQGIRVGDLLDAANPTADARWVRFESVTGYRWSLPLDEAHDALLASHVDGEELTHGHGAPLRLVAPGRRGFQWVKWVTRVDVTRRRDLGQWVAIFVSGLD